MGLQGYVVESERKKVRSCSHTKLFIQAEVHTDKISALVLCKVLVAPSALYFPLRSTVYSTRYVRIYDHRFCLGINTRKSYLMTAMLTPSNSTSIVAIVLSSS